MDYVICCTCLPVYELLLKKCYSIRTTTSRSSELPPEILLEAFCYRKPIHTLYDIYTHRPFYYEHMSTVKPIILAVVQWKKTQQQQQNRTTASFNAFIKHRNVENSLWLLPWRAKNNNYKNKKIIIIMQKSIYDMTHGSSVLCWD